MQTKNRFMEISLSLADVFTFGALEHGFSVDGYLIKCRMLCFLISSLVSPSFVFAVSTFYLKVITITSGANTR